MAVPMKYFQPDRPLQSLQFSELGQFALPQRGSGDVVLRARYGSGLRTGRHAVDHLADMGLQGQDDDDVNKQHVDRKPIER